MKDTERASRMVEAGIIRVGKSCLAKVSYPNLNFAKSGAKGVTRKTGREATAYRCPFCAHWHVTKSRHGEGI